MPLTAEKFDLIFGGGHLWEMHMNDAGLHVVKRWELFMAVPYLDSNGMWAQGYGHTNAMGTPPYVEKDSPPITELEAHNILVNDCTVIARTLKRWIKVPVTDYMFSAVTSLCLNAGLGNFKKGLVFAALAEQDYIKAAVEFRSHSSAKFLVGKDEKTGDNIYESREQNGLLLRRAAETTLFMTKKEIRHVSV